ncbi:MAG: hypothetical protein JST86_12265 [Bacteroidetes bacterium]|nr:hypothetical protein [Bacteroidota bacterium]
MNTKIVCFIFLLLLLSSCENLATKPITQSKSDTTLVLDLALRTAFYHENLPGISPLKRHYRYGDSILFSSETLPLSALPQSSDTINFKILNRKEIISLTQSENDLSKLPNYLNIGAFEKSDTGYYVSVESLSTVDFGGGGVIGIYIKKEKDSLIVVKKMSSNLN